MAYTEIKKPVAPTATEIKKPSNLVPIQINDLDAQSSTINGLDAVSSTINGLDCDISIYHEIKKPTI